MKNCSHCGGENDWNALTCLKCGTLFEEEKEEIPEEPEGERISNRLKWGLYFGAWGAVTVGMSLKHPAGILKMLWFPVGFVGLLPGSLQLLAILFGNFLAFSLGWAAYLVVTKAIYRAKRRLDFFRAYLIFWIVLLLNVAGWLSLVEFSLGC